MSDVWMIDFITMNMVIYWILLSVCMVIQMTNGSSSFNLNDICPSVPPDMMEACPYTFSEHTHNMIKQIPKIVPLDHPDYHQLVPPQARGKTNLYCAHPACTPNPCLNGGSCQETFADFDCNCTALYVGKRCEKRNTITDVKFLETGSRQGVVSFLPIKKDSPWEIMSFWGWEPSTSDLICKYLGYPGAYSTVDGVVLNSLPESAILGAKVVVCPGDAMIITDCWLTDEIPLEGTGVVGVICCEDYKCTSPGIPLGLENGDVIDTQITASSEDQTYKTATARLHGPQCWQPLIHDKLQWLQVDLLDAHLLTGLSMQGRVDEDYYVTAFSLKYSLMGTIWTVYKDEFKQVKYFSGNVNGSSVQTQSLYPGVVTRYVRIQPWAWEGQIAIRLELVGVGPIAAWDDVIKSNCSFDIDLCGWQQALDDDSDWLHQESRVPSHDSSPAHDHMDSYGAYVVMSSNSSINQTARLQSPPIKSQEGSNSSCLQFWTYMNGDTVGNLYVYVSNNTNVLTSEHLVFARSGNQGDRWIAAEVEFTMPHYAPFYITFEGRLKSWDSGSIALDDVTITPGNCPARIGSIECDFDVTDCGWYQEDSDDTDWMFISGSPPTSSKMPQHDHSMSRDGRYLYILGAGNDEFHEARIASPAITIDDSPDKICFSFWYYALSDGTSELSVEFVEDGPVPSVALIEKIIIVYNDERVWRQSKITVYYPPPTPFHMVIVGKVKGHHILAIDDSALYYGQCLDDPSSLPQSGYIDGYQTLPVSCAVWKRRGKTSDGYYTIDPDGPGNGVHPFRVYCDMTTDEQTGIMVFTHNLNPESEVTDYELPYSYPFIVTYEKASLSQIAAAADISGECTQYIKLGCTEVALTGYTAWYDRHGDQMDYWGGAPENSSSCACGIQGSCAINTFPCNCDGKLKYFPLEDSGNITQKSSLPVSEIRVGDTGGSFETADVTLGPLYCKGEDPQSIVMDQFEFTILTNTRTPGPVIAELVTESAQLCGEACIAQDSCQSLSYNKDNGTCILKERGNPMTSRIRDAAWNENLRIWPAGDRSVNCDFGKDGCGWIQDPSDDADWIISDGTQGTVRRTGPLRDHGDTSGRHYSGIRSVRLVDGRTPHEGRVEIFYKGQWASVCGITWSLPQGNILCQSLGFGDARHVTANTSYVQGSGEVVVDLQCNGGEGDIRECPMRDIGHTACPHTDEAGVVCSPGVRLTGGVTPREGTVELLYNGSWGSICHNNWDIDDANVICRGLGYDSTLNAVGSAFYIEGSGEILIDDVSCAGYEESVFDCGHSPIGETTCDHDKDAGVFCSYEDDSEFYPLKGSFLYIDSSEQLSTANITRLQSPIIQIPVAEGALCFRFWYYMFGEDVQSLRVYVNDVEDGVASGEIALEISGNHGEQWIMDQFDIVGNDTAPFTLSIEAVTGVGVNGDIAIDDIEVLAGSCPYEPMSCDFEESFICAFIQDEEDDADWRRGKGDVIQNEEKPPYDKTFYDIHGFYMYFNSNETVQGSTALLWTPPYTFPGQHCLSFYYFMHGSEIGSLQVYTIESGGTISGSSPVWDRIGPQGFEWKKAATTIVADSNFQVVFEATNGGPTYSYIAIDDVTISKGPCVRSLQDGTSTQNTGCRKAIGSRLGVEDGRIPDSAFSASSDNGINEPHMARLNSYDTNGGWIPADGEQSSWIEVNVGLRRWLTGALTQGVLQSSEWSTLLSFSYVNESNERAFIAEHECNLPGGKIFRTNFDSNSIVTTIFPKPVLSANIRIHVEGSHSNSALRFEVLGMQDIDCDDLYVSGHTESGMYTVRPADDGQPLRAYCDMVSGEGGWMIFQRRMNGTTSFSKTWSDYENGFGALTGEHWIGLKILTRILAQRSYELRIELEYANGTLYVADYPGFSVSNRSTGYQLHVDELEGSSADPLAYHNGTSFVTPDQLPSNEMPSCDGPRPSGGWWYVGQCDGRVNLNGLYPGMTGDVTREMYWEAPNDGSPLIYTQMKIKPIS